MEESKDAFCHSRREKTAISLQRTDKEVMTITPAAEVSVTASTAVEKQLTSERMEEMEYFIEHIMQRHVQPLQYKGNSFFLSTDKQNIRAMVTQTMKNPDVVLPHKYNKYRAVKKKTFSKQVGVHGISKAPCYCVTVIFNIEENKIITAFPTM